MAPDGRAVPRRTARGTGLADGLVGLEGLVSGVPGGALGGGGGPPAEWGPRSQHLADAQGRAGGDGHAGVG
eukprot:3427282-Pyramimonas_sp.AAC.1